MALIWLLEIGYGVAGSPTQQTLRAASAPSGYNHPSAPGFYEPRIIQAANIQRSIVAPRRTFGQSEVGGGVVDLINTDGFYDEFFDYGYGFISRLLLVDSDADYSTAVEVMKGKVEQPFGDIDTISFKFKSRQVEFDRLASPSFYAGTNSGVTGTEGTPQDIKGDNKIRVFGAPKNVTPDPINAADRLYGFNHDKQGNLDSVSFINLRLNGSPWTNNGDHANIADLQISSISQGEYETALDYGAARLGGSAPGEGGTITADIEQYDSSPTFRNNISAVTKDVFNDAGVVDSDLTLSDFDQLALDCPYEVGVVVKGETYREILDALLSSVAGWYCEDRRGVYRVRQFISPNSGSPLPESVATFKRFEWPNVAKDGEYKIEKLDRIFSEDDGKGVPAWRITVYWGKIWTTQDKDALAKGLSDSDKEYFSREFRSVTVENPAIRDQYPEAVELEFYTLLNDENAATNIANHFLDLYGVRRSMYRLTASYDADLASAIDLGDIVTVQHPRYNLTNGEQFYITRIKYDARLFQIELELWG